MRYSRQTFAGIILIMAMLACNMPSSVEQVAPPSDVQTEAALTVQALLQPQATSTPQQEPQATPIITTTPTIGPTGTITPTYSVPMLKVLEQTNCRTGPGQDYEVTYTYLAWKQLEIVGNYPEKNYWLVKSPDSPNGVCWLWGEYVEVSGSYWVVSSVTPPPTKTPSPPNAPSLQKWDFFCNSVTGEMSVTILWTDNATNETGYRVIRDSSVASELPPNSSTYTETILLSSGESATYIIEVYNTAGSTRSTPPIKLTC